MSKSVKEATDEKFAKESAYNNIRELSTALQNALKSAEINKEKAIEAERIARQLSESLKQLNEESKLKSEADDITIKQVLIDAQNEREAKEIAQSDVKRLSSSLSKYETEAAREKHEKEIALQNVDALATALENALKEAETNRAKADEAERIARSLSETLKEFNAQKNEENSTNNETKINEEQSKTPEEPQNL